MCILFVTEFTIGQKMNILETTDKPRLQVSEADGYSSLSCGRLQVKEYTYSKPSQRFVSHNSYTLYLCTFSGTEEVLEISDLQDLALIVPR